MWMLLMAAVNFVCYLQVFCGLMCICGCRIHHGTSLVGALALQFHHSTSCVVIDFGHSSSSSSSPRKLSIPGTVVIVVWCVDSPFPFSTPRDADVSLSLHLMVLCNIIQPAQALAHCTGRTSISHCYLCCAASN